MSKRFLIETLYLIASETRYGADVLCSRELWVKDLAKVPFPWNGLPEQVFMSVDTLKDHPPTEVYSGRSNGRYPFRSDSLDIASGANVFQAWASAPTRLASREDYERPDVCRLCLGRSLNDPGLQSHCSRLGSV
jgi:hypothetical protein